MTVGTVIPVKATIIGPTVVASRGIANYKLITEYNHGEPRTSYHSLSTSFKDGVLDKGVFIAPFTLVDLVGSIRGVAMLNGVKIMAELEVTIKALATEPDDVDEKPVEVAEAKIGWVEIVGDAELKSKQVSQYHLRLHYVDGKYEDVNADSWSCTNAAARVTENGNVTAPYATENATLILRAMYHDNKTNINLSAIPKTIKIV